ncbi:hypothetical protein E2P81_ATG00110 [Venturia nashicola]|uniref:Uncharacterized protein n=1 Tax=Venturia nashicola TaxID=86259 RepID=A0A4Z1PVA3_9PEZI|nr:hypothetical protein E6O75_ATG00117 [Venturia nashicola]TLD39123.1 hypothetical protein E2P81_ATG00110 [Venturia nashicola]
MATTLQKPQLSALKTPLSASYPSELRSPLVATPTYIKQEESLKTPITPPAAYLDFLSKLSPIQLMSPMSAGPATSKRFTFPETKPALSSVNSSDSVSTTASMNSNSSTITSTSLTSTAPVKSSRPSSPLSKCSSRSSSCSSSHSNPAEKETAAKEEDTAILAKQGMKRQERPDAINTTIPPTPGFPRPHSARTPRRLHIPQSPYSPASVRSPLGSAATIYSPYKTSAMSPRESWETAENKSVGVSVRRVVTRTVTHYSRTPIVDPVPASKKRRTDSGSSLGTVSSTTTSTE